MIQVVAQTYEEKIKVYMKCKKQELAEMLANRDILEDTLNAFETNTEGVVTTDGNTSAMTFKMNERR